MAGASLAFEILAKDKASRVFDKAADSADDLNESVSRTSEGLGKVGEGADVAETRVMGLKDGIEGASAIMAGPGEAGIAAYLQGWADFASGVANFAVPAFKKLVDGGIAQVKSAALAVASTARAVAAQVAQWVILGVQSTIQAAKVAAAWLISIGPVIAVGAAIAGLVYLVVTHWETIRNAIEAGARFIVDKVQWAFNWIKDNWPLILAILTGPIGLAVLAISKHWDTIVSAVTGLPKRIASAASGMWDGIKDAFRSAVNWIIRAWNGLEFKIPGFDPPGPGPKFGGITLGVPDIPELHSGGPVESWFPRSPGDAWDERTVRLRVGEQVNAGGGYNVTINGVDFDLPTALDAADRYHGAMLALRGGL